MKTLTISIVLVVGLAVGLTNRRRTIRKLENEVRIERIKHEAYLKEINEQRTKRRKYEGLYARVGPEKAMKMIERGWDIVDGTAV